MFRLINIIFLSGKNKRLTSKVLHSKRQIQGSTKLFGGWVNEVRGAGRYTHETGCRKITQHATGCAHATRAIERKNVSVATNVTVVVCELTIIERPEKETYTRIKRAAEIERMCTCMRTRERLTTNVQEKEGQARVFERGQRGYIMLCAGAFTHEASLSQL